MSAAEFAMITDDDLVTGEGVALDMPPASIGVRMVSGLIDLLANIAAFVVLLFVLIAATLRLDEALQYAAMILATILGFVAFPTILETLTRGRSLGKMAMGLRTVRVDGGPISGFHALVRALIGVVEINAFLGGPAFLSMLLSHRGQRLGDHAAGTYVVRDRVVLRLPLPPQTPYQLAAWARSADMATLPTGLALAARQYLRSHHELEPTVRDRIGSALVADVLRHVAPPPPAGAPHDHVLAAVIAERRERDLSRLRRDTDARARLDRRTWTAPR